MAFVRPGLVFKCPHCDVTFSGNFTYTWLGPDPDGKWSVAAVRCPACTRLVLYLLDGEPVRHAGGSPISVVEVSRTLLYPRTPSRGVPSEVPDWYRDLYLKAWAVLSDAPEASAALSRRCLQRVLVDVGGAKGANLEQQIDDVRRTIPEYVWESLDRLRVVGNFGAHPIKSTSTGDVIEVEPGEAEANLAALDPLFDHYFVRPAKAAQQKAAINAKLQEAGKQPLP